MQPVPIHTAIADQFRIATHPWVMFFQELLQRLGPKRFSGNLANIPANLTASDEGLVYEAEDFGHVYRWNGTAWKWAPGEVGAGYIMPFQIAPTGVGWQLCNGATVSYAKEDGSTANVTLPNLTGSPAYMRFDAAVGVNAAVAPTVAGLPLTTGAPSSTQEVQSGTGVTVASDAHTHNIAAITINTNGEPARVQLLPYFRR